jgi:hypothetical protein
LDEANDLPATAEIPLLLKQVFALQTIPVNQMLIRLALKQAETLNGWMLWGLMLLLFAPPVVISFAIR